METVHTYADSFGCWAAKVSFDPAGPAWMDANIDRIRAKARRAIRREILSRENGPINPVRVEVTANHLDHMNLMHSITFKER
jgi:hypothetical protein